MQRNIIIASKGLSGRNFVILLCRFEFSLIVVLANEPTKTDEDLLEGAGKDLLQALEGVGTGAKQLAGQVIGQAVVEKTDEPEPPVPEQPVRGSGVVVRATRSLKDILVECRKREQEEEALGELEEEEQPEERGVAQQALDRYEREMEAAQLNRKRRQEEIEEQDTKKLKRSDRHRRRMEMADEEYQKAEDKRRKEKEARKERERVRQQQDALLRKAQTLVQREKNRPGKSAVIPVGEGEGDDEDMWLPDVVISQKDEEKVTKFRHKKKEKETPQDDDADDDDYEEEQEEEDDENAIDMNDPDIIRLAGCVHASNIKTAAAYEHYMRGISNSILEKVGESADIPKYYRSVVKSMWSVARNMRMYQFIKDADLQAVYKTIPDMKMVALRNRMEGKKTGAAKEIQIETEKVVEVQIAREDRRRMPINRMMANLNSLPADRQADIRLKLTRMYGHQEKAHKEASEACAIFKTLVVDKDIDLNTLRTFAEGTFRPLVAIKIPDVDRLWEAEEAERARQAKARADKSHPIDEIIEEQNLPQRPTKGTARPTNDEGKGTRALQAMVHYFVYGALFENNPKSITQVAKEFLCPVKALHGLVTGRRYEGGRQAKARQEQEEQRLLEISRMQEKGMTVKVKPAHRGEQITKKKKKDESSSKKKAVQATSQEKTTQSSGKGDPKPSTSRKAD